MDMEKMSMCIPNSSLNWYKSITSEARTRSDLFLETTSEHDVTFVVGRDEVRVYASSAVLATNSKLFKDELRHRNEQGEVYLPDISDPYAFCIFISLLHPVDGRTEDIKDAEIALRLLPLFKLYKLKKRLDECETILIGKQRELRDLHIAKEYGLRKLEEKVLEWIVDEKYSSITEHEDWSGVDHNERYKVFERMLQHKERQEKVLETKTKKLQQKNDRVIKEKDEQIEKLEKENRDFSDFIYDIRDLMKQRLSCVRANSFEGTQNCLHGGRNSHNCGSDRDCKECLSFIVRNVENIFEYYRRK